MRMKYIETIKCERCGQDVELWDSLTNRCECCGAYYNGFGQRLLDDIEDSPFKDGKVY